MTASPPFALSKNLTNATISPFPSMTLSKRLLKRRDAWLGSMTNSRLLIKTLLITLLTEVLMVHYDSAISKER